MVPHSSALAWKIPWTEEPVRLQSMGSLRVWHDWATTLSLFTFKHWRRKWQPAPVFLPGESQDGGAWCATIYGVVQNRTRLKRLSSSSSNLGNCHWERERKVNCFSDLQLQQQNTRQASNCSAVLKQHVYWKKIKLNREITENDKKNRQAIISQPKWMLVLIGWSVSCDNTCLPKGSIFSSFNLY